MLKRILSAHVPLRQLHKSHYIILRSFSEIKNDKVQADAPKKETAKPTTKEMETVDQDEIDLDKEMNAIREKLIKDLEIQRENQRQKEPTKKELRDAILFEEILKKELDVVLYDCGNFTFRSYYFGNILLFLLGWALAAYFYYAPHIKESKKWLYYLPCVLFSLGRIKYYRNFQQNFVQSVVYHTQDKTFTLMKRKFFFGGKVYEKVGKNELMYTEDPDLNKRRINYINMKTLSLYCIGYKYAWKNKELFSHLIAQRIK